MCAYVSFFSFAAAVPISSTLRGIGSYAFFFGAAGGVYVGTVNAAADFRSKKDPWNHLLGGALSGSLVGFYKRSLPAGLAAAAFAGFGCMMSDLVYVIVLSSSHVSSFSRHSTDSLLKFFRSLRTVRSGNPNERSERNWNKLQGLVPPRQQS